MSRVEQLREETKEKAIFVRELIFKGFSFKEIEKEFRKRGTPIRDIDKFIKLHPEYFEGIGFKRRQK